MLLEIGSQAIGMPADKRQRTRFMIDNFEEIDLLRKELVARVEQEHAKAQKPDE